MFNAFETSKTEQFNTIYYATHRKLHCTVLKLCRDRELTLDILQKVYLKLWEKWDGIADKKDLYPLLFTYCKNTYIDELRRNNCGRIATVHITHIAESHAPSVESQYGRKEYLEVVNNVLLRLTSRRREVVKLYLEEGLTRKKLSERLSISPNTIDNHLRESLSLLRHELRLYLKTGID
ncbi:sigma-70 family RNA polymerase sigma factor [Pedobacter polaris]|uniref:Sigma-70 family RNA polymerase sigma factor n=1 Tax=Pedobacter polaris TaxID=2571273 RepID=A0A4U1CNA5_9SPHI|nr:sigma-70 family RNA polymerase sigma factor [Pedobacter polaris]TKC08068.1 sigma-70 family RNA polymerase sigma factor [Pedobacter polaris]